MLLRSGAMRIRISDPRAARDLVRFFRTRGYLAAARGPNVVEVVPIDSAGERADRARALGDLETWSEANPGIGAVPLPDR